MTIPDWFGYKALKVFLLLNPILHVAGLAIAVWAWRATRKTGYLIVGLYFVVAGGGGTIQRLGADPAAAARVHPGNERHR